MILSFLNLVCPLSVERGGGRNLAFPRWNIVRRTRVLMSVSGFVLENDTWVVRSRTLIKECSLVLITS